MGGTEPDLHRPGIADAHALTALVCGFGVFVGSAACCLRPIRDDDWGVLCIAMWVLALWSGAFALVTRGTRYGRVAAVVGLLMAVLGVGVAAMAAMLTGGPF